MIKMPLNAGITLSAISDAASSWGLVFVDKIEASDTNPLEVIWSTPDRVNQFHYVEDSILDQPYLAWVGSDETSLNAEFAESGWVMSREGILDQLGHPLTEDQKVRLTAMLAIVAGPKFDPGIFEAFDKMLSDSSPRVRQFALLATGYPAWPQFRPLLEQIRDHDENDFVRWRAETAIAAFDAHGIAH